MKLIHSQNILDGSLFRQMPVGTIKELFIRYSGNNQSGKAVTLAGLGRIRFNHKGTDVHNTSVELLSNVNNLKGGVAEFFSTLGGAFGASVVLPFHAFWDEQSGLFCDVNTSYVQLDFSSALGDVQSGTVEVYAIMATRTASYFYQLIQRNIQAGGAGTVTQPVEIANVSELYVKEDSNISQVLVLADGDVKANGSQTALKAYSNSKNRVESAISVYEIDLNPFDSIRSDLNREVTVQLTTSAAANVNILTSSIAFASPQDVQRSIAVQKLPPVAAEDQT
jgi:stage V sporulation protein SpoVS